MLIVALRMLYLESKIFNSSHTLIVLAFTIIVLYKTNRHQHALNNAEFFILQIRDGLSGDIILNEASRFSPGTIIGVSNSVILFLSSNTNVKLEDWSIFWSGVYKNCMFTAVNRKTTCSISEQSRQLLVT